MDRTGLFFGPEDWDRDRDDKWESVKDELDMSRDEWEEIQNVNDYGYCKDEYDPDDDKVRDD